jgi:hypothetical protein
MCSPTLPDTRSAFSWVDPRIMARPAGEADASKACFVAANEFKEHVRRRASEGRRKYQVRQRSLPEAERRTRRKATVCRNVGTSPSMPRKCLLSRAAKTFSNTDI